MVNYPLGSALIAIKNSVAAGKKEVALEQTKLIRAVVDVLASGGFLKSVQAKDGEITAAYVYKHGRPKLMDIKLISKPGLRVYRSVDELKARRSPSRVIVSTPRGIRFDSDAIKQQVGGEVLVEVW